MTTYTAVIMGGAIGGDIRRVVAVFDDETGKPAGNFAMPAVPPGQPTADAPRVVESIAERVLAGNGWEAGHWNEAGSFLYATAEHV
jgi:hypothetical protein